MRIILWFRRDLRVTDHPALAAAVRDGQEVLPLFLIDPRFFQPTERAAGQVTAALSAVHSLANSLAALGNPLLVRTGDPLTIWAELLSEWQPDAVYASADITPFAKKRDRAVQQLLTERGVTVKFFHERTATRLEQMLTQERPYQVFSPFFKRWQSTPKRPLAEDLAAQLGARLGTRRLTNASDMPDMPDMPDVASEALPTPGTFGFPAATLPLAMTEAAAQQALQQFVQERMPSYADTRDDFATMQTSQLSVYLRHGLLSPIQVLAAASEAGPAGAAFIRQLAWRDFYYHLLDFYPKLAVEPFQSKYRDMEWQGDGSLFDAWCAGRTGVPIIDAAMRQLVQTGELHNRLRMLVSCFLTKHLGVDWKLGERFFAQHLLDYDAPLNIGGWQWSASVGTDAVPYFRVFNPVRQSEQYDPEGHYLRRWLPELADLPATHIHAPWSHGHAPAPIVDLAQARAAAIERFALF